ncbi:hypothetical protein C8R43DRAFT_356626 [Mycena crocata]|nr:hypothetical protein C8R43DRAFT_356626 [Mycena crocata]
MNEKNMDVKEKHGWSHSPPVKPLSTGNANRYRRSNAPPTARSPRSQASTITGSGRFFVLVAPVVSCWVFALPSFSGFVTVVRRKLLLFRAFPFVICIVLPASDAVGVGGAAATRSYVPSCLRWFRHHGVSPVCESLPASTLSTFTSSRAASPSPESNSQSPQLDLLVFFLRKF